MRAIQLAEPKRFARIEAPEPGEPAGGQALVRTHRMGICGTDVSCYLGKFPFFDYPRIPGHELGVEVLAVGAGVSNVAVGDRCSVEPYLHCDRCYACSVGATNCCENLKVVGVMQDGGLCDRFLIDAAYLHPSTKLAYEQLALVETLAIGCHAADRGAPTAGEHALVIGAGPIGLATLEFTRLTGANVTVMDMSRDRLDFVAEHYPGVHTVRFAGDDAELAAMKEITGHGRYEVVTDATGNHRSMSAALKYVAPTGTLVYVGITTDQVSFPHPVMHRPEITIKASRNALPDDFTRIIGLIEDDRIDTGPWITHRTAFDDLIADFENLLAPDSGVIKAMIEVN